MRGKKRRGMEPDGTEVERREGGFFFFFFLHRRMLGPRLQPGPMICTYVEGLFMAV